MNTDIELDYKQELFSLIDRLSGHIKFACEDMEAKTRPELKNCTYAILYDKFITFLERRRVIFVIFAKLRVKILSFRVCNLYI